MKDKAKLFLFAVFGITVASGASAETDMEVVEIVTRYNISRAAAAGVCRGLSGQINSIKTLAGVSVGMGVAGTAAGAVAYGAGIMKVRTDRELDELEKAVAELGKLLEEEPEEIEYALANNSVLAYAVELAKYINANPASPNIEARRSELAELVVQAYNHGQERSEFLGNVRTVSAAAAGVTGAVGAVTAFTGAGNIDELVNHMNSCSSFIQEIENQMVELRFAEPRHPVISEMDAIVRACSGLNSSNIENVKGRLRTAGVMSVIGATGGVVSAVASGIAVSRENRDENPASATTPNSEGGTQGWNRTANIASAVAISGNLGGALISGTTLSGLRRNGEIADNCRDAF